MKKIILALVLIVATPAIAQTVPPAQAPEPFDKQILTARGTNAQKLRVAQACGWYAISFCAQNVGAATDFAKRSGVGYVINTSDANYPNFRAGGYCVVIGPLDQTAAEQEAARWRNSGVSPTAYSKNACAQPGEPAIPATAQSGLYITAAINWTGNKAQFFLNNGTYIRYDFQADRADEGYPRPINDNTWPGMGPYARMIVAACNGPIGKAYFFLSDGQYLRYDIQSDRMDPGYPKPIDDRTWPGMGRFSLAVSSALSWKNGKIQFFLKNGQYIRYDIANDRVDEGYPKDITESTWPGLPSYNNNLAGIINRTDSKAYIFLNNGQYLRYDIQADRMDPGYPKQVDNATWPGLGAPR